MRNQLKTMTGVTAALAALALGRLGHCDSCPGHDECQKTRRGEEAHCTGEDHWSRHRPDPVWHPDRVRRARRGVVLGLGIRNLDGRGTGDKLREY
jgi:hypothetical protein